MIKRKTIKPVNKSPDQLDPTEQGKIDSLVSSLQYLLYFVMIVALVVIFVYIHTFGVSLSRQQEVWGQFGDFFGGLMNPLLGFFSLIALLSTVILQRREIALTRKELALSTLELKKSAIAQQATAEAAKQQISASKDQQFESTFFSMLTHLSHIQDDLMENKVGNPPNISVLNKILKDISVLDSIDIKKIRLDLLSTDMGHNKLFIYLYQFLKFVATTKSKINFKSENIKAAFDGEDLTAEEKLYSNIIRSTLSSPTLRILILRCATSDRNDHFFKYKLLVERYKLFEHVSLKYDGQPAAALIEAHAYYDFAFGDNIYLRNNAIG